MSENKSQGKLHVNHPSATVSEISDILSLTKGELFSRRLAFRLCVMICHTAETVGVPDRSTALCEADCDKSERRKKQTNNSNRYTFNVASFSASDPKRSILKIKMRNVFKIVVNY